MSNRYIHIDKIRSNTDQTRSNKTGWLIDVPLLIFNINVCIYVM